MRLASSRSTASIAILLPMKQHHYIRAWRKHHKLTIQTIADRVEKDKGTVSKIENFKLAYTQESLEAIANAIGHNLEAADLLSPPPDPRRPESEFEAFKRRKLKSAADMARALRILRAAFGEDSGVG